MNNSFGILCLDSSWKITAVSAKISEILMAGKSGSEAVKTEDFLLGDLLSFPADGAPPRPELVEAAFSAKADIAVVDFICSPDKNIYVFCLDVKPHGSSSNKNMDELYRQNKKLTAIGIFSGGIAHDYNNALTAVLGNISLAKFEADQNRELAELLDDAEKASIRIKTLTERLTSYSRGIRLNKVKLNFTELIKKICDEKKREFSGSISIGGAEGAMEVEGDPDLLAMAIECIIQNSIEAVGPAAGRIGLDIKFLDVSQDQVFREMTLIPGRYIRLTVADNGAGVASGDLNDIFNPYFTTKEDHDGIGLALAYSILKRHRGFISVESEQGQGSTFMLYLPLF